MRVIIPGEPMRYGLRLVAYAPNGPRLGILGQHLGFEAGMPLNDVPSLRLTYSTHAAGGQRVDGAAGRPVPPDQARLRCD
jgi:hypothetical protein